MNLRPKTKKLHKLFRASPVIRILLAMAMLLSPIKALCNYPDPSRVQSTVNQLYSDYAPGGIVFTGSSTIRLWHRRLTEDFSPLDPLGQGISGTTMNDLLYYLEELVLRYQPSTVVLYQGDNDANIRDVTPEDVITRFDEIIQRIHQELPEAQIFALSVKPSISRWSSWPKIQQINALLIERAKSDPLVSFVDVATSMLDQSGNPKAELFSTDELHLNSAGYDLWTSILRPLLLGQSDHSAPMPPRELEVERY